MNRWPNTIGEIVALTPIGFEELVADLLQANGYRDIVRTGGANDRGIDIRCRDPMGTLTVVQCKRLRIDRPIDSPTLQTFIGMAHYAGAERAIFVTSSLFTREAERLAREHPTGRIVELVDGDGLFAMMERAEARSLRDQTIEQRVSWSGLGNELAGVARQRVQPGKYEQPGTDRGGMAFGLVILFVVLALLVMAVFQ